MVFLLTVMVSMLCSVLVTAIFIKPIIDQVYTHMTDVVEQLVSRLER